MPWQREFVDARSEEVLLRDGTTVRRQVTALDRGPEGDAWRGKAAHAIQRQRAQFPELPQIELLSGAGGVLVPVIRGELLVRAEVADDPLLWPLLEGTASSVEALVDLDKRLLRLRVELAPKRLDALARFVRRSGYQASANHVTPLAPVAKADGGPEQTQATLTFVKDKAQAAGVAVAVLDTGIAKEARSDGWLSDLLAADASNVDPLDALPADGLLDLGAGHGTFAAGIVQQVAPMARLSVHRVLASDGVGSEVDVAVAIVAIARETPGDLPLVLSLSLGAETLDDQPLLAIEVALEILYELHPEALVVAAAGNSGSTRPNFPAASRSVVAVAALDAQLQPAEWSNRGFWVDCCCVGEGVLSTFVPGHESVLADSDEPEKWGTDPWALWSGTSFAAPQVAAAVARRVAESGGTPREALAWLFDQAPRVPDMGHALRFLPGTPLA